jgi:hypothetical protein
MAGDPFTFSVQVDIKPLWMKPAESAAQEMGRAQTETRLMALSYDLSRWLREALERMTEEELRFRCGYEWQRLPLDTREGEP